MTKHLTVLTGGSRGLGLAMAQQLLKRGDTLLCISRQTSDTLPAFAEAAGATLLQWSQDLAHGDKASTRLEQWLYTQADNNGHAAVIDGYDEKDGKFYVHINQGAGGYGNGWYDFFEPIASRIDDLSYRVLFTVR